MRLTRLANGRDERQVTPEREAKSISAEDAGKYLGFLSRFAQLDNPTSSVRTREQVGWRPTHPGLLAYLEGVYFQAVKEAP